jgi:DNA-binding GntR family transcriptional regulator
VSSRSIDISAEIAEQIRDMIGRGIFSPGVHLIPARIAEEIQELALRGALAPAVNFGDIQVSDQFSVSRMPVREALKLLVGEGIVTRDQNRGFFVARLSTDEASQLYRLRHLIEAELLNSIVWPTKKQLKALQAQMETVQASFEHKNVTQSLYAVRDFHRMIFDLSPKKILMREAMRFWTLCDRYRSLLISSDSMHSMDTANHLMDALTRQDRDLLLKKFADDLHTIESDLTRILGARGL